jgi:hypothetical protein
VTDSNDLLNEIEREVLYIGNHNIQDIRYGMHKVAYVTGKKIVSMINNGGTVDDIEKFLFELKA